MMSHFMVEMHLPEEIDNRFMRMIPAHRAYINELISEGTILSYSVNFERSKGWIIFLAENAESVLDIVEQFPIHPFIEIDIHELFIHDGEAYRFPRLNFN